MISGLCDTIATSDDLLLQLVKSEGTEVYNVKYNPSHGKSFLRRLLDDEDSGDLHGDTTSSYVASAFSQIILKTIEKVVSSSAPDKRF